MNHWLKLLIIIAISNVVHFPYIIASADTATPESATAQNKTLDALEKFQYKNHAIHPACVRILGIELQQSKPCIAACDLEGCTENSDENVTFENGFSKITRPNKESFLYRHLGVSPKGIHVLQTLDVSNGSGIFCSLLFVRFTIDQVRTESGKRQRILMTSVGSFVLGDRDDGEIKLASDELTISKSRYRQRKTVIHLDQE